jgi:hypothetical protein
MAVKRDFANWRAKYIGRGNTGILGGYRVLSVSFGAGHTFAVIVIAAISNPLDKVSPKTGSRSRRYVTLHREPRLSPCRIDKNGSQCDERSPTDLETQFRGFFLTTQDSNPLKKP